MDIQRPAHRAVLAALILAAPAAQAAGTAAGVVISNTASATYTHPLEGGQSVQSNAATLQVDEILDVTLVANDAGNVTAMSPATAGVLSFTVTNTGNGPETYLLSPVSALGGDQFDPANIRLYLDSNGNGVFDGAATDPLLTPGTNDPALAADASQSVFLVSDIPGGLASGDLGLVRLVAEAKTARATPAVDAPGTAFAGQGEGGSDAVVGGTQAYASRDNGYLVAQVATTLSKSQAVLDPFGGSNAIPGATITYSLVFAAAGTGSLTDTQVVDAIPAGTTYVPNSLTLDGAALTDSADSDAGRFTGSQIEAGLGSVAVPASHTITFQVTIN